RGSAASIDELTTAGNAALRGFDPRVRFAVVQTLQERFDRAARSWTLGATLFSVFGMLALIVAAIGLYSVLAFDVAQRARELGIRSALGAEKGRLLRTVVRDGVALAAAGVVVGLGIALAAGPWVRDLLFEISPRDPAVLGVVSGVILTTGVLASLVPAL